MFLRSSDFCSIPFRLDMENRYHSVCVCGRSFLQPGAFTKHNRTCQSSKKRLSSALDKAKQLWKGPKRRRLENNSPEINQPTLATGLVLESPLAPPAVSIEVRFYFISDKNDA